MELQNQLYDSKIRGVLSSLWLFYFVNHFFMSLHEFANPIFLERLLGGFDVSDSVMLMAAIMIEIPIAMIVLSRVLPNKINWIVNIVVAILTIGIEIMNNLNPDLDNMFFITAELIGFVAIIVISLRWRSRLVKENRNEMVTQVYAS